MANLKALRRMMLSREVGLPGNVSPVSQGRQLIDHPQVTGELTFSPYPNHSFKNVCQSISGLKGHCLPIHYAGSLHEQAECKKFGMAKVKFSPI
jgi:hypothetical protein